MTQAFRLGTLGGLVVACGVLMWACGTLKTPTVPEPTPDPRPIASSSPNPNPTTTPILGAPAKPSPSPDPNATPTPDPSASPTPNPADAAGCGSPLPPPLSSINVKIHQRGGSGWILDSTPLVGPDATYCAKIGFTDGRSVCPVRMEGDPQRSACELYVTGRAHDTGRNGPTWSVDGMSCTGQPICDNSPDNQYQVIAYKGGTYSACGNKNDVCGSVQVDR